MTIYMGHELFTWLLLMMSLVVTYFTLSFLTYETEFVLFLAVLANKYLSWVYGVDRKICHEGHCSASRGLPRDGQQ